MVKDGNLKSFVEGYKPTPFFFKQHQGDETGLVAWTIDLSQLKQLFYRILQTFTTNVEILLKIEKECKSGEQQWNRYYGEVSIDRLQKIIKSNEKYVFQDGSNQLCVKRSDTGEYIVLDDHGILFIYSGSLCFAELCKEAGLEERLEKLIYASGHWHRSPKDADKLANKFIRDLGLKPIS